MGVRWRVAGLLGWCVVGLVLTCPVAAHARLGDTFLSFRRSPLLAGDRLFRFEGRIGARFRFGAASRSRFGTALLFLDTQDGTVVQQTLLLPLPRDARQARQVDEIVALFLQDSGLGLPHQDTGMRATRACYEGGKGSQGTLGDRVQYLVACDPTMAHLMIVVGLKPTQKAEDASP